MPLPTIIVHNGAKTILSNEIDANQSVCLAAIEAGWTILRYGGSAKDAVEAAIRSLEAELTSAPSEALLAPETEVFLDAGLMEGERLRWGAIAKVQRIRHPISVARKLLEQQSMLLVGEGAERFAAKQGCELYEPDDIVIQNRQPQQRVLNRSQIFQGRATHPTFTNLGCVALDATGLLVAGTLVRGSQTNGGVGSTVIVGSGLYASRTGACATSGDGGAIMTVTLAKTVVDLLDKDEHPEMAAGKAIQHLNNKSGGRAGCIVLDSQGQIGWSHNYEYMPIAYKNVAMDKAVISIHKPIEIPFNLSDKFNPFHL